MIVRASLRTRLVGAFAVVALIAAAVGLIGYRGMRFAKSAHALVATVQMPGVNALWMIKDAHDVARRVELVMFQPQLTEDELAGMRKNLANAKEQGEEGIKAYDALPKGPDEEAAWKAFKAAWAEWGRINEGIISGIMSGSGDRAAAYETATGTSRVLFHNARVILDKLIQLQLDNARNVDQSFNREYSRTRNITLASVFLGVVLALGFGIFLSASLSGVLSHVAESLDDGAACLTQSAAGMASSSRGLAEGASSAAASLEETSAAMEEMSSMTRQNAENASMAKQLVGSAGASVDKANDSMGSLVSAMNEISRIGEETGKIVKTIDEIAFQTNLLALNAAVEAARAGEAGAGFAVVADEVRNLAQRAAGSARNTSGLIEATVRKIKEGTGLVEKTNVDFQEVATTVHKVMALVGEISAASAEQSRGITEIGGAVSQLDRVTQQSAAGAEEVAASASELGGQALSLERSVQELQHVIHGGDAGIAREAETIAPAPGKGLRMGRVKPPPSALKTPAPPRQARRAEAEIPLDDDHDAF
ncbi:MAG TPA: methyl-accepting chemotaxis protein [Candidatus Deferrimicrobiaceae bacterium]